MYNNYSLPNLKVISNHVYFFTFWINHHKQLWKSSSCRSY